jgi:hypothetical protein
MMKRLLNVNIVKIHLYGGVLWKNTEVKHMRIKLKFSVKI